MEKCLTVNTLELTNVKASELRQVYRVYYEMVQTVRRHIREHRGITQTELHHQTYRDMREQFQAPSQLVISARVYAWNLRKHRIKRLKRVTVRFDKRLFRLGETGRGNPVFSVRVLRRRIGVPVRQDGAYERLKDHLEDGWEPTSVVMTRNRSFYVTLRKELPEPKPRRNVLGVDVNSAKLAVTVLTPEGKVLRQLYYGQDIYVKQIRYEEKRAKLQEKRDNGYRKRAGKALRRISGKQRNYVKTRMQQIVSEMLDLAKRYDADIAVERLRYLRKRKGEWRKKSRKIVNRMPYGLFRFVLKYKAGIEGVKVVEVKPEYTSQTCALCGHISKRNWIGYSYFRCEKCGYECDRDRNASRNIAFKGATALGRAVLSYPLKAQFPKAGMHVMVSVCSHEGASWQRHIT